MKSLLDDINEKINNPEDNKVFSNSNIGSNSGLEFPAEASREKNNWEK